MGHAVVLFMLLLLFHVPFAQCMPYIVWQYLQGELISFIMPTDAEGKDTFQTDKSCLQSKTVHSGFVSILLMNNTLQSKDRRVAF